MCDAPSMEMPRYVSHKRVWALEIADVGAYAETKPTTRVSFRDPGYEPMDLPYEMFARYVPTTGDFLVVYADGYKSFSPRKAFLEGYTREAR